MHILTFLFLCLVWGTTWIAIKLTLVGFPPFLGASIRFFIAILFLLLYIFIKNISLRLKKRDFNIIFCSAFLMYVFDYGFIYWGEQYLSAGVTAILFGTFVLFTALWSYFMFQNEHFYLHKFVGLILGMIGISTVFFDQLLNTQFNMSVILGSLAIVAGAAGGALSVVIVKKYLNHINAISLAFYQMVLGTLFLAIIGGLVERHAQFNVTPKVIYAILYLGCIGSALAFGLYYWLLQNMSAITLSLIIYITPIVAVIFDYLFFGEIISVRALVGMAIIFSGIALTQIQSIKQAH